MIAKITRGSVPGKIAAYLHGPGRAEEHVYADQVGGAVIAGNLTLVGDREGRGWAAAMADVITQRPEVSKPVWQVSISAKGDRELGDAEWRDIAAEVGQAMGWNQHPWVAVRHGADHIHVVVSRVGFDGQLWHGQKDYAAAMKAMRTVEREHSLRSPVPVADGSQARLRQDEVRQAQATGDAPTRSVLAARMRTAVDAAAGQGRPGFEAALEAAGIEHRANVASTGHVSGYSVHMPGHLSAKGEPIWYRASELDRALSWTKVAAVLAPAPEPAVAEPVALPRRRLLESRAAREERGRIESAAARAAARTEAAAARLAAVPEQAGAAVEAVEVVWLERARAAAAARAAREAPPAPVPQTAAQIAARAFGSPLGKLSAEEVRPQPQQAARAPYRADPASARPKGPSRGR